MIAVAQENRCGNQQAIVVGEVLDLQHLLQENRALRCDKNIYKSLLERATTREQLLKQEIQQLNARIRYLEKRLYGRKSEKKTSKPKSNSSTASSSDGQPKRSRGHQPGSPGHGRRDYRHLRKATAIVLPESASAVPRILSLRYVLGPAPWSPCGLRWWSRAPPLSCGTN